MEQYLEDKDIRGSNAESYLRSYLTPLNRPDQPTFVWNDGEEKVFSLQADSESRRRFEGVVLSQEDSLQFTELKREELATRVLKGYSTLADYLSAWIGQEEKDANAVKLAFTRKHNLNSAVKRSNTAYSRLAQGLLQEQLGRPARQFLDWLSFVARFSTEEGRGAAELAAAWANQQANSVASLSEVLAKLQGAGCAPSAIAQGIRENLDEYDRLASKSVAFHLAMEGHTAELRERLDQAIAQMEAWGYWLAARATSPLAPETATGALQADLEDIARERVEVVKNGKALQARLDLLDKAKLFLSTHWSAQHPDICPVCESKVANRQGIEAVVTLLRQNTSASVQELRSRYAELQERQKNIDANIHSTGAAICPVTADEQAQLRLWLAMFQPAGAMLEDWLIDPQRRKDLTDDLSRMQLFPEPPKPYADAAAEAHRLAEAFIALAQEADRALEDPQAIAEVKRAFEQRMEAMLTSHLPATLGKVWQEITLELTTAPWLLPARPVLHLGQRGRSLSIQLDGRDLFVRYIYNAAERHVLGLAWFFTYYLARRRYEEAWMLLDDPAHEMDQPSFREFVRFCETLLRLHSKAKSPFTLIVAMHQEDRALDVTRATDGRLYTMGWKENQDDSSNISSVKKVLLLAPGFHPLKPDKLFKRATASPTG